MLESPSLEQEKEQLKKKVAENDQSFTEFLKMTKENEQLKSDISRVSEEAKVVRADVPGLEGEECGDGWNELAS